MFVFHTLLIHPRSSEGSQDEPHCFALASLLLGVFGVAGLREGVWLPVL